MAPRKKRLPVWADAILRDTEIAREQLANILEARANAEETVGNNRRAKKLRADAAAIRDSAEDPHAKTS
jgi:hypothetical protein